LAHRIEQAGVGGEVGARRAPDGLLVDAHQAAYAVDLAAEAARRGHRGERGTRHPVTGALILGLGRLVPEMGRHQVDQCLAHQAR
ncbi:hypothetical protein DQE80_16275, partial [Enterococcus sp. HPCN18]